MKRKRAIRRRRWAIPVLAGLVALAGWHWIWRPGQVVARLLEARRRGDLAGMQREATAASASLLETEHHLRQRLRTPLHPAEGLGHFLVYRVERGRRISWGRVQVRARLALPLPPDHYPQLIPLWWLVVWEEGRWKVDYPASLEHQRLRDLPKAWAGKAREMPFGGPSRPDPQ